MSTYHDLLSMSKLIHVLVCSSTKVGKARKTGSVVRLNNLEPFMHHIYSTILVIFLCLRTQQQHVHCSLCGLFSESQMHNSDETYLKFYCCPLLGWLVQGWWGCLTLTFTLSLLYNEER